MSLIEEDGASRCGLGDLRRFYPDQLEISSSAGVSDNVSEDFKNIVQLVLSDVVQHNNSGEDLVPIQVG